MSLLRSRRFAIVAGLTSLLTFIYVGSHSRKENTNLESLRSALSVSRKVAGSFPLGTVWFGR
jgi:hypothetical protein